MRHHIQTLRLLFGMRDIIKQEDTIGDVFKDYLLAKINTAILQIVEEEVFKN